MNFLRAIPVLFLLLNFQSKDAIAQSKVYVYVTPSGTHYHTAKCQMVDNTSNSILLNEAIEKHLKPCTFCKPDQNLKSIVSENIGPVGKPGQKDIATQCIGLTKEGRRCERKTRNANGYCFQHLPQAKT